MIPQQQTPEDYYAYGTTDQGLYWGGYQFVSLKDVIDELLIETTDSDSYLKNTRRSKLFVLARNGIRELNRTIKKNVHAVEMQLDSTLSIPVPQDYVDWVRVSVVGEDNKLKPLSINNRMPTYVGYLQDNNNEILFDNDGNILQSDGVNAYSVPFNSYTFNSSCGSNGNVSEIALNGECKIDNNRGRVVFSSNLVDEVVVFEYVSDGLANELNGESIKVHKHLTEALKAYVYAMAISMKRNIPANEKRSAKEFYKGLRHKALMSSQDITISGISKVLDKNML